MKWMTEDAGSQGVYIQSPRGSRTVRIAQVVAWDDVQDVARLMAAAPSLLAALEWALKHVPKHGTATYESNRENAIAAYAEARGHEE